MALIVVLIALVIGSLLFHALSPWWLTPVASNWSMIDATIDITLWITGAVFIAVNLFMAWAIYRYRHQPGRRAHYEPENKKLETGLTLVTAVGVAAMLAPGLWVWAQFVEVPDDAHEVEVLGQQWDWRYRFPGTDGVFGRTDPRWFGPENPFAMSPDDPHGLDDVLVSSNELHLPLERPVKVLLRSKDVLHNFAVPQFRVKMDMVPGQVSYLWLTPTRTGRFDILCMELCGIAHYTMRGSVVVQAQADFDDWLALQSTWADGRDAPSGDPLRGESLYRTCTACHGAAGEGNKVLEAPRLAGLDSWYLKRQLRYFQTGVRGSHELDVQGARMAPFARSLVDETAIRDVAAHIESFALLPAVAAGGGDARRGAGHFDHCAACHGSRGEGNAALGAPRLAGQHGSYLKRQLDFFRSGIRGAHVGDRYGHQMGLMARTLQGRGAVDDIVAYLDRLAQAAAVAANPASR